MITTSLLVAGGAMVGALSRYGIGRFVTQWTRGDFPWGTWMINVSGTLLLGLFFQLFQALHHAPNAWLFLGTGFCGAYTTFSTMSVETVQQFRSRPLKACGYVGSSYACGFILAWITQWI
ncbi:CrcB family protein [Alicyclobacillus cycloheptanicus]|uniref:fluoride efflux transporter FluC n=1 Tax=Alicyclobacillus cycloheptanicus TaxID=1457 RepID=UPI0027998109|nr:CrcB family protein [Alicyclobacillus cycloheptanicus]